ncbi:inositol monophosphatase family protein [Virgibacillus halodenitrificans]|uniref:inositol-phosphate phosphatase n=1 Tax=Virgibacillus halodenitrificans TaxID=1482 RepID=A0ABR7VR92_VIRHA|nr:inositol monophosphatase family protein [Virgibacillus halodenitrificans]MBD1224424.1 inositol monophosphatase family protein [Virgibacillus halodenitrificans]
MNTVELDKIFDQAKSWVLEAGETIRTKINDPLTINTKSNPNDLVTEMDKETELFFAKKIKDTYPDHLILSEEGFGDDIDSLNGTVWIIDPIDGTMNFVHQKRNFAISIGIYQDGVGEIGLIYNVIEDVLYSAIRNKGAYKNEEKLPLLSESVKIEEAILGLNHFWLCENRLVREQTMQQLVRKVRGTRTYGSAALEFAYVAEGIMDGYLTMRLSPWDIAAGVVIVNEVGGTTTDINGDELNMIKNNSVFTCNPRVQHIIIDDYLRKGRK